MIIWDYSIRSLYVIIIIIILKLILMHAGFKGPSNSMQLIQAQTDVTVLGKRVMHGIWEQKLASIITTSTISCIVQIAIATSYKHVAGILVALWKSSSYNLYFNFNSLLINNLLIIAIMTLSPITAMIL